MKTWNEMFGEANDDTKAIEDDGPTITCLADVEPLSVEWLWKGRIPFGMVTMLDGDPGLGKSTLAFDIAARLTSGRPMPGETVPCEPAGVLVLTLEDSLEHTVVPRMLAAGADVARVFTLTMGSDTSPVPLSLPNDIAYIRQVVLEKAVRFVLFDPLVAYLSPDISGNRDQDVRRALAPLASMARTTGAAVLAIRHLNKGVGSNPLYRGGGSIGIIGAARSGLLVAKDPDDSELRVLASAKLNVGVQPGSLQFRVIPAGDTSVISWEGESTVSAAALLAQPATEEERGELQEAIDFLKETLLSGPLAAEDVKSAARKAGIADRTLARAKHRLGVNSIRQGFGKGGSFQWQLPPLIAKHGSLIANTPELATYGATTGTSALESSVPPLIANWQPMVGNLCVPPQAEREGDGDSGKTSGANGHSMPSCSECGSYALCGGDCQTCGAAQ